MKKYIVDRNARRHDSGGFFKIHLGFLSASFLVVRQTALVFTFILLVEHLLRGLEGFYHFLHGVNGSIVQ